MLEADFDAAVDATVARYDRPEPFSRDYTAKWAMDKREAIAALFSEGVPIPQVKALTGHRSDKVLGEYWRKAKQFSVNLSSKAGL